MSVIISPHALKGRVTIPPSKSMSHRMILCAALAKGKSRIRNVAMSDDIKATLQAVQTMGRTVEIEGDIVTISGDINYSGEMIDCNESGSTLRFIIPLVSVLGGGTLTGAKRLGERPLNVYQSVFEAQGLMLAQGFPLKIPMGFSGGKIAVSGSVSSQFISGLMLAAPLLNKRTLITLTTPLESSAYVDMTIQAMAKFDVKVNVIKENQVFEIEPYTGYVSTDVTVEGDWSQAGFWLTAGLSSQEGITIDGLNLESKQGDRVIIDLMQRMGAEISSSGLTHRVKASFLKSIDVDISQCPDLAPVVAALMSLTDDKCRLTGCARLRIKESDRVQSIAEALKALGGQAEIVNEDIHIFGKPIGGNIKVYNDHRIAMMAAALSAHCEKPIMIDDETVVNKSYPAFWNDFKSLGGVYE